MQDFYLEDVLKFIGYKASDNYTQDSHDIKLSNGEATAPLTGQQKGVIEQAIMDAFLKGDEGSWERLLEVTGAQEGAGNAACLNVAHQATGEMGYEWCIESEYSHQSLDGFTGGKDSCLAQCDNFIGRAKAISRYHPSTETIQYSG